MVKAIAQFTITDLNDAIISGTQPTNPTNGMLWIKRIDGSPDELYSYNDTTKAWEKQTLSLASLDPDQNTKLDETAETTTNLNEEVVPALDARVTNVEGVITLKANKTDVDSLTGRVEEAEATLVVQADQINSKVSKETYDELEGRVTNQQTTIEQLADSITQTVTHQEYDELSNTVSEQETKILQTADEVSIMATRQDNIDGRLTTAEASITTQAGQIALKAEANSVYTKTETDSKLGTKVDTTTYNNKIAEIQLTTDGITQRVSNTEGDVDAINGNITNIQSDVSTLEQTASQIQTTVSGIQSDVDGIEGRVTSAETQITQNKNEIALRAKQTDLDSLTGRVSTTESNITQQAGQIATKVAQTTYDADMGVNAWVGKQYSYNSSARVAPTFDLISQLKPIATKAFPDALSLSFNADYYIGHFSTNVYVTSAKDVAIQVKHDDNLSIFLNGVSVYGSGLTITTFAPVTLSLKAGWNTIDILLHEITGGDNVTFDKKISTLVEKMSFNGGLQVVDSRLLASETAIKQNADAIALKANQTDLNTLTGRVSTAEANLTVQANQIASKVSQTSYDTDKTALQNAINGKADESDLTALTTRVTTAESSITQNANEIATKVEQSDFDALEGRMSLAETSITQNTNSIALKANQTDVNALTGRVDNAESQLTVQAGQISSKVSTTTYNTDKTALQNDINSRAKQSDLASLTDRVTTAESSITQNADAIELKVDQTEFDTLSQTVTTQGTQITQNANAIALKAEKSDVYTKTETDTKLGTKVDTTTYNNKMSSIDVSINGIKSDVSNITTKQNAQDGTITELQSDISTVDQKADSIQSSVTSLTNTVNSQGTTISQQGTSITQLNNSIALKAEKTDVYTKAEADGKINTAVNNAKAEIKVTTDSISSTVSAISTTQGEHEERLSQQQSSIEQLADSISQKVEYSEFDQVNQQMSTQETEILQTKSDITLLANRTTQTEDRLTTAEASIQVNADAIESKVSQTDFDDLNQTVTEQGSTISQHATAIALKAEQSQVYTKTETDTKLGTKVDTTTYNNKIASIELDIDGIQSSVSNITTELDTAQQDITTVTQKADSIESDVSSLTTTVNNQGTTIASHTSSITQLNNSIALKAEKSDVYTKTEADNKTTTAVNNAKAEIKLTTDGISQSVSSLQGQVNNMQIGGRQLLRYAKDFKDGWGAFQNVTSIAVVDDSKFGKALQATVDGGTTSRSPAVQNSKYMTVVTAGQKMTFSMWIKRETAGTVSQLFKFRDANGVESNPIAGNDVSVQANTWYYYTQTFTVPTGVVSMYVTPRITTSEASKKFWIAQPKLEVGDKATDFSVAIEDIDANFGDVNQTISNVDQKADSISSTVSSLQTTVTSQGTRIANAETAITQNTNSINLKANATDVYNKTETDNKLGTKVDTTTYNNKMSAIDVSINGINQTVSNQTTEIDNLTGTVTSHTSQISTLDQRADGFDLSVSQLQEDVDGVEGRVTTAEANITANTNAIALKANQSTVDTLTGRVSSAESQLTVQAGQIASKVSQTDYDDAVGLNKWTVSKYNINLGSATAIPTFAHLKTLQPNEIVDFADAQRMQPFTAEYYIAHFFTNVYLNTAKTVTLNITADDTVATYMNGAMISQAKGSVALSLRKGWNTVEFLFYEHTGSEYLDLGLKLSSQVDKLTSKIGVGDKNDTRLVQAETSIKQNADAILLKADTTTVTSLGNRVTTAEGSISVLTDEIATKVAQTDFDAYSQRLTNAESTITQHTNEIALKVDQTDYDLLNGTVQEQQSQIQMLNESISLKVDESVINGLDQRISDTETEISLTKDEILLKANQTDLDEATGRLSQAEATLSIQADQIASKVSQTDFNTLDGSVDSLLNRMSTAETNITQTSNAITLKADKSSVYTKGEVDTKTNEINGQISDINSELSVQADQIATKVARTDVYIKGEVDTALAGKTDNTTFNALVTRVSTAETNITQTSNQIALKANASDVYTKGQVDTSLGTKANSSDLTALASRVSTAESSLTVQANQIASKVAQTTYDALVANIQDSSANNLIHNTEWKTDSSKWTLSTGWTRDTSKTYQGSITHKVDVSGLTADAWRGLFSEYVNNISEGQSLTGSVYTYADSLAGEGWSTEIEWYNATARISTTSANIKPTKVGEWQRFSVNGTAPAGTTRARLRFHPNRNGTFWVARPMLQYGKLPSAWSPHIDEMAIDLSSRLSTAESSITQNSNSIALKVNTSDFTTTINGVNANVATAQATAEDALTQGSVVINPIFKDWNTSGFPTGLTTWNQAPTKETTLTRNGGSAMRFNVTADATQAGAGVNNAFFIPKLPNNKYYFMEVDFMLVSGALTGACVLLDWSGMTPYRAQINLSDQVPSPELNKWYTVRAIMKRPTDSSTELAKFTGMSGYLLANWNGSTTNKIKDIIFDRLMFREATTEEIKAYESDLVIKDMATDGKITPIEKQQLKKEWATMVAEKTSYDALATTYGITTEKTNYGSAYDTLNATLNGTGGILTSMTTTSTVDATTFRGQFDDYYDKKAVLTKKINETARTLANSAQSTANTANSTANTLRDTTVPALTQRMTSAESSITTLNNSITSKVTMTEVNQAVDGVAIGGANLIRKSFLTTNASTGTFDEDTNTWTLTATNGAGGTWGAGLVTKNNNVQIPIGSWYTVSAEIWTPVALNWNVDVNTYYVTGTSPNGNDNDDTAKRKTSSKALPANQWTKIWFTMKNKDDSPTPIYDNSNFGIVNNTGANVTFKIRNVQGELGNKATDYSPAVEDVIDGILVGGRNLVRNSTFNDGFNNWSVVLDTADAEVDKPNSSIATYTVSGLTADAYKQSWSDAIQIDADGTKEYTLSFDIKTPSVAGIDGGGVVFHIRTFDDATKTASADSKWEQSIGKASIVGFADNKWTRHTLTFRPTAGKYIKVGMYLSRNGTLYWREIKLEAGNKASDYSPAPEDFQLSLETVSTRLAQAEQVITEDSITATVMESTAFGDYMSGYVDTETLGSNYATLKRLEDVNTGITTAYQQAIADSIKNIDLDSYSKFTTLKQSSDDIKANFVTAGGVNLIKNSVGYAGFDSWLRSSTSSTYKMTTVSHDTLEALGFGSGFRFEPTTASRSFRQVIKVTPDEPITFSWVVNKLNDGTSADTSNALVLQILKEDGSALTSADGTGSTSKWYYGKTTGYEFGSITYTPKVDTISVRVYAYMNADATVTGLMLNKGVDPLQWSMAHGEIYNTAIKFDLKGIRVSKIEDLKETQITVMTPDKFGGYYDVNGDGVIDDSTGSPDEVFRMDEDYFIMKKATVKEEMSLGTIKMISINSNGNVGWAFVPAD